MFCNSIKRYLFPILLFAFFISFADFVYFTVIRNFMMSISSEVCVADFLEESCAGNYMNLIVIPICSAFITELSDFQKNTINYYYRMKSRKIIALRQFVRVLLLSITISTFWVLISSIIGGLFSSELINWNSRTSYSYLSKGLILDFNFFYIFELTFFKILLPILFFSQLECIINLVTKKVISFFIVVLLSGVNVFGYVKFYLGFICDNAINPSNYLSMTAAILLFIIFPLLITLSLYIFVKLFDRKDFI